MMTDSSEEMVMITFFYYNSSLYLPFLDDQIQIRATWQYGEIFSPMQELFGHQLQFFQHIEEIH